MVNGLQNVFVKLVIFVGTFKDCAGEEIAE